MWRAGVPEIAYLTKLLNEALAVKVRMGVGIKVRVMVRVRARARVRVKVRVRVRVGWRELTQKVHSIQPSPSP